MLVFGLEGAGAFSLLSAFVRFDKLELSCNDEESVRVCARGWCCSFEMSEGCGRSSVCAGGVVTVV